MNVQVKKREGFIDVTPDPNAAPVVPEPAPAAPVQEPEIQEEKWPIVVRLMYRSIQTPDKGELKELSFREPRGGDINRYGNPVRIDQAGDIVIDERKMTAVMAALSGVLQPFLEAMDPRDWNSCAYRLRTFFLPDPRAW